MWHEECHHCRIVFLTLLLLLSFLVQLIGLLFWLLSSYSRFDRACIHKHLRLALFSSSPVDERYYQTEITSMEERRRKRERERERKDKKCEMYMHYWRCVCVSQHRYIEKDNNSLPLLHVFSSFCICALCPMYVFLLLLLLLLLFLWCAQRWLTSPMSSSSSRSDMATERIDTEKRKDG